MPLDGKIDVVGSKILKIFECFLTELGKNDFMVGKSDWEWDKKGKANLFFLVKKNELSKNIVIRGPLLSMKEHAMKFRKIHKKTFAKNSRLHAIETRRFMSPEDLIKKISKSQFVKEKTKGLKIIPV